MTRRRDRLGRCSEGDALRRLDHAWQFLDVAELAADEQREDGSLEYGNAAATLAVLAGIAATDAACCKALGVRSRADDHRQAESLVAEITDGGATAAKHLRGLLALKDNAQYGFYSIGTSELTRGLRQARAAVRFAEDVIRRLSMRPEKRRPEGRLSSPHRLAGLNGQPSLPPPSSDASPPPPPP